MYQEKTVVYLLIKVCNSAYNFPHTAIPWPFMF